jgi:TonB family protein
MKHGRQLLTWYLMLCMACALAAQESAPESKGESSPQSTAQQPQADVRPLRVRVSRSISQAMVEKKVQPEYPPEARAAHIQGEVVLRIIVSREGGVSKADLISGHPLLAEAAKDAVKQWKYRPFLLNGHPAEVDTEAVVTFRLEPSDRSSDVAPPDQPPVIGVVGDAPGGYPGGQTGGVIGGIISSTPTATPRIAAPERVRVSQGVSTGLLVKKVNPEYPPEARRGRIQGTVLMHAIISKGGDIATLELVSGHPALAPAAIEAVKQWKYKPYLLNGKPVEVDTQIQVNFALSEN